MEIEVRSGMNRFSLELTGGESVAQIYERVKTAMNLDSTENLTVSVDGEAKPYSEVSNYGVASGSVVEFVKRAGSKGTA